MINTNVGDMPLDIFSDYLSDTLNEEWYWQYLIALPNDGNSLGCHDFWTGNGFYYNTEGHGFVYGYVDINDETEEKAQGDGNGEGTNENNLYYSYSPKFVMGDGNGHNATQ